MTRAISWSYRKTVPPEKLMRVWRVLLWGFFVGASLSKWQVSLALGPSHWTFMLTFGLPLEWPNTFKRLREADTWWRVGFLCFAVCLFMDRKETVPCP